LPGFKKINKREIRNLVNEGKLERIDNNTCFSKLYFKKNDNYFKVRKLSNITDLDNDLD